MMESGNVWTFWTQSTEQHGIYAEKACLIQFYYFVLFICLRMLF